MDSGDGDVVERISMVAFGVILFFSLSRLVANEIHEELIIHASIQVSALLHCDSGQVGSVIQIFQDGIDVSKREIFR